MACAPIPFTMTKSLARRVATSLKSRGYAAIVVGTYVATDACERTLADTVAELRVTSEVK